MLRKGLFLKLSLLILFTGCAPSMLNVQSSPEGADVYIKYPGQQKSRLGSTPLSVDSSVINTTTAKSAQVIVIKDGYSEENFLVPKSTFSSSVRIDVKLQENKLPLACTEQDQAVEKVARSVAQAQSYIQTRRYEMALRTLLNLRDSFPNSSVVHDLLGNTYYLLRDLDRALVSYEKSLELDPSNSDTKRMVRKLQTIDSVRTPAGN